MPILLAAKNYYNPIGFFSDDVESVRLLDPGDQNTVHALFTFSFDANIAMASRCFKAVANIFASPPPKNGVLLDRNILAQQRLHNDFVSSLDVKPASLFTAQVDLSSKLDNTKVKSGQYSNYRHVVKEAPTLANVAYNLKRQWYRPARDDYANYLSAISNFDPYNPSYSIRGDEQFDEYSLLLGSRQKYKKDLQPYQAASTKSLDIRLFDQDTVSLPQVQTELSSIVDISFLAVLNKKSLKGTSVFVSIDMLSDAGKILQTISKSVDLGPFLQASNVNFAPRPAVAISNMGIESRLGSSGRRITISSGQAQDIFYRNSPNTPFVRLPQQHNPIIKPKFSPKVFSKPSKPTKASVTTLSKEALRIPLPTAPRTTINVPDMCGYLEVRAIDGGGGYTTSKLVDPRRDKVVGYTHAYQESGVVTVRMHSVDISPASSVVFYSRNVTTRSQPKPISRHIYISPTTDPENLFAIDKDFMPGHVYEYYSVAHYRNGQVVRSASDIIRTLDFSANIFPIVSNKQAQVIQGSSPQVSFDISIARPESISNDLLRALRLAGLEDYFKTELQSNLDRFSELVSFGVHRYDVTTGERCDLGNVYDGKFNDAQQSKKFSAPALQKGHSYMYEIRPSLSTPQIVMNTAFATSSNVLVKSNFTTIKTKVSNPYSKALGLLLPDINAGAKKLGMTPMELGMLGCTTMEQVFFPEEDVDVVDLQGSVAKISRFEHDITISWGVTQVPKARLLDHFVVYRNAGSNSSLKRCHAQGDKFLMRETVKFAGTVTYLVQPVYVNGKMGAANTVQIDLG